MVYKLILFLHVFSAVLSIGPFFVLLQMMKKLKRANSVEESTLLAIFKSIVRLIKHAGHVLVITGVLLIYLSSWSWSEPWILMTLLVMFGSIFFLANAFTPTIQKFQGEERNKPNLINKLKRTLWIYISLLMIMLWFMVAKPRLW